MAVLRSFDHEILIVLDTCKYDAPNYYKYFYALSIKHTHTSSTMPSLSSLLLGTPKPLSQPPLYTFHGPDATGQVYALNSLQAEVARFTITKGAITRLKPTHKQICTFKRSSLSGTTTLNFPGQHEIKIRESWEGMRNGKDIHTQNLGLLKWRAASGGYEELQDGNKKVIARGKLPGAFGGKASPLEVFVAGDEFFLDLVMVSWISMLKGSEKEGEEMEVVGEVVSALAGS